MHFHNACGTVMVAGFYMTDVELIARYDSEIITSADQAKQFLPCDLEGHGQFRFIGSCAVQNDARLACTNARVNFLIICQ